MAGRIVEYRIYEPIIKQIFVEVDETGNVYDLNGAPWLPPAGVKLRTVEIVPATRAMPSESPQHPNQPKQKDSHQS